MSLKIPQVRKKKSKRMRKELYSSPLTTFEKRIRLIGVLNFIALLGTLFSLLVFHPLAFIEFAVVGVLLMLIAIVLYLMALLRAPRRVPVNVSQEGGGP
jgi:hypothetical protein